jgi:hypothetical protein
MDQKVLKAFFLFGPFMAVSSQTPCPPACKGHVVGTCLCLLLDVILNDSFSN